MTLADVWAVAGAVITSLGGGALLMFALSSWLGKVWAKRILESDRAKYATDIERVKSDLERSTRQLQGEIEKTLFVHRLQFETEGAAKTGEGRIVPISTKLAGVIEMARTELLTTLRDASGQAKVDDAALLARSYVFRNAIGQKVGSVKRAWETAVLKAHGHTPQWTEGGKLSPESRAMLAVIDLHLHDLRHEGASRRLEAGWPLHHIQDCSDTRI